jgi:hypothetical protein
MERFRSSVNSDDRMDEEDGVLLKRRVWSVLFFAVTV